MEDRIHQRPDTRGNQTDTFEVEVRLYDEDHDTTRSRFYFNGKMMGYGLEDEKREEKVHGETRIPDGRYEMALRYSPKFSKAYYRDADGNIISQKERLRNPEMINRYPDPHELIWVKDVPGFEFILWHWGNYDHNTDGCYLVGSTLFTHPKHGRAVGQSRMKYEEIYPILWRAIMKKGGVFVTYNRDGNSY